MQASHVHGKAEGIDRNTVRAPPACAALACAPAPFFLLLPLREGLSAGGIGPKLNQMPNSEQTPTRGLVHEIYEHYEISRAGD